MHVLALILAVGMLQDPADAAANEAVGAFKTEYKTPDVKKRAAAAGTLGKVQHFRILKILARLLVADLPEVRIATADALGRWSEHKANVVGGLRAALQPNSKNPVAHAAIVRALGNLRDLSAIRDVDNRLNHRDAVVSAAAIEAAGKLQSVTAMDRLISLLRSIEQAGKQQVSSDGSVRRRKVTPEERTRYNLQKPRIFKAFKEITGQSFKNSDQAGSWWNKNRRTFRVQRGS